MTDSPTDELSLDEPPADDSPSGIDSFRTAARRTWTCLLPHTRRNLLFSAAIGFVLAMVDAAAIGLLPTLVNRVDGTDGGWLSGVSLPALGSLVVGLLLAKSIAGAGLVYWQSHFLARDEGEHTIDLFAHYLARPYGTQAEINTNEMIGDLHSSMVMLYRAGAAGLGLAVVDILSLLTLVLVVFVQSPITGAALGVLGVGAGALYSLLIRKRVAKLGETMRRQNAEVLLDMNEGLGSVKTVKAFEIEPTVVERFTRSRRPFEIPTRDYLAYLQLARYYLEIALVVVLGACVGVVYLAEGQAAVFGIVGLLSVAAARAMPAMVRLLNSITNVRVTGPIAASLHDDLQAIGLGPIKSEALAPELNVGAEGVIALDAVTFRYPRATSDALSGVSLEVRTGEIVAVLGGSGSGKTTLVDVLIGLLQPESGSVRLPSAGAVGYVAQDTFVWDDGVGFNVSLGRSSSGKDEASDVWSALRSAHLADWVRALPEPLDTPLGERGSRMSGGQRQRLGIARALYGHPSFLVLDEPTSALDVATSRSILETLTELKGRVGIVVVTHDPLVLEYASRHVKLEELQRR